MWCCWSFSVASSSHSLAGGWLRTASGSFPSSQAPSLLSPSSVSFHSTSQTLASYIKPGSAEQGPLTVHVVWVNHGAFRLQWCPQCCFHRPPRTYHCPWCNICVEDFDHHCKWVNNCIGHRNFRFFMLLVLSLCLYSGALLVTCLIFLVRTTHLPFSTDKAVAIVVAVPAAGFLVPLSILLLTQAVSVSSADRTYKVKCRDLHGYNPFDQGCASNWYLAICAPLGPKYMAEAVQLQRVVGPDWTSVPNLHPPMSSSAVNPPARPGPQPQPLGTYQPGKGPPGCGEAAAPQELHTGPVPPLLPQEPPDEVQPSSCPVHPRRCPQHQHLSSTS
ncbi:palmitoyltransferase ZDHHC19 [Macaca fascicularis]|uniref:palmitoyltransferase ZDHHC19 n=1 Tax=Macaca fascicularis TaxID=9541 RepID=UPI0032B08A8F